MLSARALRRLIPAAVIVVAVLGGCVEIPVAVSERTPTYDQPPVAAQCHPEMEGHLVRGRADTESEGLDPARLRLLNWNVWKGQHKDWLAEFRQLSRGSDIVTLQEVRLAKPLVELLDSRALNWDLAVGFVHNGVETGVMTLARERPEFVCAQRVEEPWLGLPKTALVTRYPLRGLDRSLMVANVHAVNFTVGMADFRDQVGRLVAELRSHEGPIILAGDFNSWSEQRNAILGAELKETVGLRAVLFEQLSLKSAFGYALDHVYYRGLTVVDVQVRQAETSDHPPMLVVFEAAEEPGP